MSAAPIVLVVDDDAMHRLIAHRALDELRGDLAFRIEEAGDAYEALRLLARLVAAGHYVVVVSDLYMEGVDGLELLQRVRSLYGRDRVPFLLLTGTELLTDREEGLKSGADDYLVKPLDLDSYRKTMAKVVKRWVRPAVVRYR